MTEKRFEYHHQNVSFDRLIHCIFDKETQKDYSEETLSDLKDFLNDIVEENQSLKEEKGLLKNKLDRIEDILPHFLSCAEISEFRSKTFKEDIALMKCWNKRYQK